MQKAKLIVFYPPASQFSTLLYEFAVAEQGDLNGYSWYHSL